jgi:hypothetical protein
MSLPAGQERVLHDIEGALKASEPHLASMFAIFARLNQGEPVGAELVQRSRLRWLRPGTAMSAIVLIPVMFVAVIIGAVLSGSARGATTCEVSRAAGGPSPLMRRPICPQAHATASNPQTPPAPPASGTRDSSCTTAVPVARFTTRNGGEQVFSVPARTLTTAVRPSGVC